MTWNPRTVVRGTYRYSPGLLAGREEIPELLNRRGLLGVGAEVGVYQGNFSDVILSRWDGKQLISIDPWREDASYRDEMNVAQTVQDRLFETAADRLSQHEGRSLIWRMTSLEGSTRLEDEALDFVYIDARHDFDSVLEDLALWYPKVRRGGVLAGHDYLDGVIGTTEFGVRRAVDRFFSEKGVPVWPTRENDWRSWIVVKPTSEDSSRKPAVAFWEIAGRLFERTLRARRKRRHANPSGGD